MRTVGGLLVHVIERGPTRDGSVQRVMSLTAGRSRSTDGFDGLRRHLPTVGVWVRSVRQPGEVRVVVVVVVLVPILAGLGISPAHPDVSSDADTTALFGKGATQSGALGETWEPFCAEDVKGRRLDLHTMDDVLLAGIWTVTVPVIILGPLELLVQTEAESVFALVANRKVGEDEVNGGFGTFVDLMTS